MPAIKTLGLQSTLNRANAIVTFGVVSLIVAASISHLTSYALKSHPTNADVKIEVSRFLYVTSAGRKYLDPASDEADFLFDLKADLRPLWNWNSKILFVYLTAEYVTRSNVSVVR
eukprot:TRINITY_DN2380_c0_g1_i2.p1 TRINITY_DN2380_c0_g1~~TRINITY_DN2380_c0_g1_i2.p1  ORF type:complete len:115 (-),score=6.98 TRINITY_DN2380_c0_g1_i2:93-437(-)